MGYRIVLAAAGACLLAGVGSEGCGGSADDSAVRGDGGQDGGQGGEASFPEASAQQDGSAESGGGDSSAPTADCGVLAPSGRQIVSGLNVAVEGVTSDGYAVYADTTTNIVYAVSIASDSGTPIPIGKIDPNNAIVAVSGTAVYIVFPASAGATTGALTVWSAATGYHSLSSSAYAPPGAQGWFASVSQDGTHIVYLDGTTRSSATLTVATTDGKTKRSLVSNVDMSKRDCQPWAQFSGGNIVATYCPVVWSDAGASPVPEQEAGAHEAGPGESGPVDAAPSGDGSTSEGEAGAGPNTDAATIASFLAPGFDAVSLADNCAPYFGVDSAGAEVLVSNPLGLFVYPIGGGTGTAIDRTGVAGMFTNDGKDLVYTTNTSALKRSQIAAPPSVTLVPSGLATILAVSPDENWVVARNGTMGSSSNLYLASATTPGAATPLSPKPTAALFGDPFTLDSRYALFFTNVTNGTGDLYVASTTGGIPTKVTSNAWQEYATGGTKAIVNDNYNMNGGSSGNGIADIESFDAMNPTVLKTLVTAADANFYPTATRDGIVYSWSCVQSSSAGIWVLRSP